VKEVLGYFHSEGEIAPESDWGAIKQMCYRLRKKSCAEFLVCTIGRVQLRTYEATGVLRSNMQRERERKSERA
jgi:hypothetical protein